MVPHVYPGNVGQNNKGGGRMSGTFDFVVVGGGSAGALRWAGRVLARHGDFVLMQ